MKLEFLGGLLLNGDPGGFGRLPGKGAQIFFGGCDLHRNYGLVILSFLCNYDNLTLKLHQEKRSYPNEDGFSLVDSKLEVCQERVLSLCNI